MGWRSIISGESRTLGAIAARFFLAGLSRLYGVVVGVRNYMYEWGWMKRVKLAVPVICVGNITVGGTGKTPMVIWLSRYLQARGHKVAVLSRGYKSRGGADNDEIRLLREALPGTAIVIDGDRVRGGHKAIKDHGAEVIVLDDGFQHRRLQRDLDIVLIDCSCPFGYGSLLPRGLLREPAKQLRRADAVVLTRSDMIEESELAALKEQIGDLLRGRQLQAQGSKPKTIACSRHEATGLYEAGGGEVDLAHLQGKNVYAFCGIGNPASFEVTLKQLGARRVGSRVFADHTDYNESDLRRIARESEQVRADWLVTTEKDWVKLGDIAAVSALRQLHWLKVETVMGEGTDELSSRLEEVVLENV